MGRWYDDDEERQERIQAARDDAAHDRLLEQLEAEHLRDEHDDRRVRSCPLCECEVEDAEEGASK